MKIRIKLTLAELIFINDVHDAKYQSESTMCKKMMDAGLVEYQYGTGAQRLPVILTKVGHLAWEQNQPKEHAVQKDMIYASCVEFWLKEFHKDDGWAFGATPGKALKSIIVKLQAFCKHKGLEGTDTQIIESFKKLCQSLPEWYKTKDLPVIDSKFNEIVTEILQGKKINTNSQNSASRMFGKYKDLWTS